MDPDLRFFVLPLIDCFFRLAASTQSEVGGQLRVPYRVLPLQTPVPPFAGVHTRAWHGRDPPIV